MYVVAYIFLWRRFRCLFPLNAAYPSLREPDWQLHFQVRPALPPPVIHPRPGRRVLGDGRLQRHAADLGPNVARWRWTSPRPTP
jgi:hypothetical protein